MIRVFYTSGSDIQVHVEATLTRNSQPYGTSFTRESWEPSLYHCWPVKSIDVEKFIGQELITDFNVMSIKHIIVEDEVLNMINSNLELPSVIDPTQLELFDFLADNEPTVNLCIHEKGMTPFKGTNDTYWHVCKHCGDEMDEVFK